MAYTYDETMQRLASMRADFDEGFHTSDRRWLDGLHKFLFCKPITITGCLDCYRDAYLLIYSKLKRDGKMPELSKYRLRPGMVIHYFGTPEYYVLDVTEEVAEKYLKEDKTRIKEFERYPEDWENRIFGSETTSETSETTEAVNNTPETTKPVKTTKRTRSRR